MVNFYKLLLLAYKQNPAIFSDEMGTDYTIYGRNVNCIRSFDCKTWKDVTTWCTCEGNYIMDLKYREY